MFGTPGIRTPLQNREMTAFVLVAITLLAALISVFVVTRAGGPGDSASGGAAQSPVMPGMGAVMPESLRVQAGPGELNVAMGDYWFKAGTTRLRAGSYTFKARNYGVVPHDIMVERTPIKLSAPNTPIDAAAPYGLEDMQPGATASVEIMLGPGRWELFCSVPGHYEAGQRQVITVYGQMPRGMRSAPRAMAPGSGSAPASGMDSPTSAGGARYADE